MSTSIHGVVEYQDSRVSHIKWDLGEVFFPSTNSDIQEVLGMWPDVAPGIVPQRGHPEDATSIGYHSTFTALALRGSAAADVTFDEYGHYREGDGLCLSEEAAERWLSVGSKWLEDEWQGGYRRISDPDMKAVNWITAAEYKQAIDETLRRKPTAPLGTHRAVLAAMLSLESDGYTGVRFIYGGS